MKPSPVSAVAKVVGDLLTVVYLVLWRRQRSQVLLDETAAAFGRLLLVQEYENYFSWNVQLYWEKNAGTWVRYALDHEGDYWQRARFALGNNDLVVSNAEGDQAHLDLTTGALDHLARNITYAAPASILLGPDPDQYNQKFYPESQTWNTYWPAAIR